MLKDEKQKKISSQAEITQEGLPWWSKWLRFPMQEPRSIPGSGKSPGEGHGNPLQYSCLENPMDRGPWCATVQRVAESWTQLKRISTHARRELEPSCHKEEFTCHMPGLRPGAAQKTKNLTRKCSSNSILIRVTSQR